MSDISFRVVIGTFFTGVEGFPDPPVSVGVICMTCKTHETESFPGIPNPFCSFGDAPHSLDRAASPSTSGSRTYLYDRTIEDITSALVRLFNSMKRLRELLLINYPGLSNPVALVYSTYAWNTEDTVFCTGKRLALEPVPTHL